MASASVAYPRHGHGGWSTAPDSEAFSFTSSNKSPEVSRKVAANKVQKKETKLSKIPEPQPTVVTPDLTCTRDGGCSLSMNSSHQEGNSEAPRLQVQVECTEDGCALVSVDPIDEFLGNPLSSVNSELALKKAEDIIKWAANKFGEGLVLTTSFGIQSAVMLHLVTKIIPNIKIIWIDTGFLPCETYVFAEGLIKRLNLNIKVYQPLISAARLEALYGKMWEIESPEAHEKYGYFTKVEPMNRALRELNAKAVFAGLRADQTSHRKKMLYVNKTKDQEYKICPILSWAVEDVHEYLVANDLPYHPLKDQGYETVGDAHSSRPVKVGETNARSTRFHGRAQECGLHMDVDTNGMKTIDASFISKIDLEHIHSANSIQKYVLYTQISCKYCKAAETHLKNLNLNYVKFMVGKDISVETLIARIGQSVSTVPQIFVEGKYLGGYNELVSKLLITPEDNEAAVAGAV